MNYSKEQILQISKGDPEIAAFISSLLDHINQLNLRIHELERQLGQNSQNSSKPPSSDGLRKPVNLRTPGGKKGAPKGHRGTTLCQTKDPDEVLIHPLHSCPDCLQSLVNVRKTVEKRQVFDLPPPRIFVTEHQVEKAYCSHCRRIQRASFPEHVKAPVQYGNGWSAWTVYLHAYQLLPLNRISCLFNDLTGHRPSEASLLSMLESSSNTLQPLEQTVAERLLKQPFIHADETGCRVGGKTEWMHVISDEKHTLLRYHVQRGSKAMDAHGFLPRYTGTVVHDCMQGYFKERFTFDHALCNVHLLRECKGIAEHDGHIG